jgi:hypothetical protein
MIFEVTLCMLSAPAAGWWSAQPTTVTLKSTQHGLPAASHSMSRQSLHTMGHLLTALLASAAVGTAAFSAPECNLTAAAGYSSSYLQLLARGQQLGTELMSLPRRYIMISP